MILLPHIEIIRLEDAFPDGMFGALLIATRYFCATLEPPEYDNKRNFSCIPAGQYECERIISERFNMTVYEICNVPDRNNVEFHPLNWAKESKACIGLGEYIDRDNSRIYNSRKTFTKFLNLMQPYEKFRLTIKEAWA